MATTIRESKRTPIDITFNLIVPSQNDGLYTEWKKALDDILPAHWKDSFHFIRARLDDLPPETRIDAIVSPANSYGRMDGAFDDAISRLLSPAGNYFGLTHFVQSTLYQRSRGFVLPGTANIIRLPEDAIAAQKHTLGCRHLIVCPTMPWPQDVSWDRYIVYNTMWSLLVALDRHNTAVFPLSKDNDNLKARHAIRSLLMPGLGTGTGMIPYRRFALQFALAIKNFDESLQLPTEWNSLKWSKINDISAELEATLDTIAET